MACQYDQMCDRLKAGNNGAVHLVQALWDKYWTTKDWGFLMVEAKNVFSDIDRVGILWKVRHLWTSVACFVFN